MGMNWEPVTMGAAWSLGLHELARSQICQGWLACAMGREPGFTGAGLEDPSVDTSLVLGWAVSPVCRRLPRS